MSFPDFGSIQQEAYTFPPNAETIKNLQNSGQGIQSSLKKKLTDSGTDTKAQDAADSLNSAFGSTNETIRQKIRTMPIRKNERFLVEQVVNDAVTQGMGGIGKTKNNLEGAARKSQDFAGGNFAHPFKETVFSLSKGTTEKPIKGVKGYSEHVEKQAPKIMQQSRTKSKIDETTRPERDTSESCQSFSDTLGSLFGGLDDTIDDIENSISGVINKVSETIGGAFGDIKSSLDVVSRRVQEIVGPIVSQIDSALSSALDAITPVVTEIVNTVEDVFDTTVDAIGNAGQSIYDLFAGQSSEGDTPAGEGGLTSLLSSVSQNISQALATVSNTVNSVANSAAIATGTTLSTIEETLDAAVGELGEFLTQMGEDFGKAINRIGEEIGNLVNSIGSVGDFIPAFSLNSLFGDPCAKEAINASGTEELKKELKKNEVQTGTGDFAFKEPEVQAGTGDVSDI